MSTQFNTTEDTLNPLDSVEEILSTHNWVFNRMSEDELMVELSGKACNYRLFFIWQEDMSAMQFCCQYDLIINNKNHESAARTLVSINENLWIGHFDIPKESGTPSFRHTCLFRGMTEDSRSEYMGDLIDISLAQCERYHPTFHILSSSKIANDHDLELAIMDTKGES